MTNSQLPCLPGHPTTVHFGQGVVNELPASLPGGERILIVASNGARQRAPALFSAVAKKTEATLVDRVPQQSTLAEVSALVATLQGGTYDRVLAVGGGTTMDVAKALAMSVPADAPFPTILAAPEGFADRCLALICVPTTLGSGSDVTPWATIWDRAAGRKRSLSHPSLHPAATWIDVSLASTVPRSVRATSGLDALSHAMEAIWNIHHSPRTDALAARAIRLVFDHLPSAEAKACTGMAEAALAAGLAMSRTQTAAAHAMSYPLTLRHNIPHGHACALSLPWLVRYHSKTHPHRSAVLHAPDAGAVARKVEHLVARLGLPTRLRDLGLARDDLTPLVEAALASNRMSNTVGSLTADHLHDMLHSFW